MVGQRLSDLLPAYVKSGKDLDTGAYFFVKSPVFPWGKFPGVDTVLGPEMRSTGEVMGVADNLRRSLRQGPGRRRPEPPHYRHHLRLSVNDHDKAALVPLAKQYVEMGFRLVATHGTADVLADAGLQCERVFKVKEGRPNVVDLIKSDRIHLILNTPRGQDTFFDEKAIRRAAVLARIPTITTIAAAQAAAEGIAALQRGTVNVYALQTLHAEREAATA